MTQGIIKTQGSRLYFAMVDSEIHKVACPTGIGPLSAPATAIPSTCLDSTRSESAAGIQEWAQISVPVNFIPDSAAHQALEALADSRAVVPWLEILSDQTGTPSTFDSDGYLVSPGPTTNGFMGYVVDFPPGEVGLNEIVRTTLVIQPSGELKRDRNAPTLA